MSQQPKWRLRTSVDEWAILEDETGVYSPEVEYAQETMPGRRTIFELYRFSLDRLKRVVHEDQIYYVPFAYEANWPHPIHMYKEWYLGDLESVANTVGRTKQDMLDALCSDDPEELWRVYQDIGSYHGFANLDAYPLMLSEAKFKARKAQVWK